VSAAILLTGATGYIGGRLLRSLEDGGRIVRCLTRHPERVRATSPLTEIASGDCLDEASLDRALTGVDCAYYLVHSMAAGPDFAALDLAAALNFGRAARRAGVRRIIYLGGLAGDVGSASEHLRSRVATGDALRQGGVPVIEFQASIVIGAGSLSFEMIRALVERLPIMICPRWVATLAQPIALDDVLAYLVGALDVPDGQERVFEIGGPDRLSYGDILREYARLRGLRRLLLPVPVLTPRLSGLWLGLVTPAQARVGRALVEGLRNASIVRSGAAFDTFRVAPTPLGAALARAIDEGRASRVRMDTRAVVVEAPASEAFAPVRQIGGAAGWYYGNFLWRARGTLDRWIGGVGMSRGRRDRESCRVGDIIDSWTVEAFEPDRRLRLSADLKLPGRGCLEFEVTPLGDGRRSVIRQTATFDPRGLLGRAYWLAVQPVHTLMFRGLLRALASRAEGRRGKRPGAFAAAEANPADARPRRIIRGVRRATWHLMSWTIAAALAAAPVQAQAPAPVRTVESVDLERYLGEWFEIARFPNRFQRGCASDVRARYGKRDDGRIDVINQCRTADGRLTEARGVARKAQASTSAKLKVRFAPAVLSFLPFVWGDYWILGLAADYSWAVVGSPNREYLWVLARTPQLDAGRFESALDAARLNGFAVERLVTTSHTTPKP
jgi:lipocalin/uncharacterized protein YbjT (DUF2867 family)